MIFDHNLDGTPEARWRAGGGLDALRRLQLPADTSRLTVLAAHPDDESLGAGGLIASAARAGWAIEVIVATDGDASHPQSPTHSAVALAQIRRREVIAAVDALAADATVIFLGLPDGRLAELGTALEHALAARMNTQSGWLAVPWHGDRHPDHEACARAARVWAQGRIGVRLLEYPIWAWHWAQPNAGQAKADPAWLPAGPPRQQLCRIDLDDAALAAKQRALAFHHSQTQPLSYLPGDEAILSAEMLAHFSRPFETFVDDERVSVTDPAYFDDLYAATDDPWGLAERVYERRKRQLLLASLPRLRFRRAFEPGAAIGLLTDELALRCDYLLATDTAERAVELARDRVARHEHVHVEHAHIPDDWPDGRFDLIVLSEVGYYCADLDALSTRVVNSLELEGMVVACHWRHPAPEHPHTAEAVHAAIGQSLRRLVHHEEEDFVLDIWSPRPQSLARETGIIE